MAEKKRKTNSPRECYVDRVLSLTEAEFRIRDLIEEKLGIDKPTKRKQRQEQQDRQQLPEQCHQSEENLFVEKLTKLFLNQYKTILSFLDNQDNLNNEAYTDIIKSIEKSLCGALNEPDVKLVGKSKKTKN